MFPGFLGSSSCPTLQTRGGTSLPEQPHVYLPLARGVTSHPSAWTLTRALGGCWDALAVAATRNGSRVLQFSQGSPLLSEDIISCACLLASDGCREGSGPPWLACAVGPVAASGRLALPMPPRTQKEGVGKRTRCFQGPTHAAEKFGRARGVTKNPSG